MEQNKETQPNVDNQAAIAPNPLLNDVLSRKVFRAYCCGKKRHKNQLNFISNGYDGTGVFCKPNRGCNKHIA